MCSILNVFKSIIPGRGSAVFENDSFQAKLPCFCGTYVFPIAGYVTFLSATGVLVTSLQAYQVLTDGPVLSNKVLPLSQPSGPLDPTAVRDIKLVLTVFELALYLCLFIGVQFRFQLLLLPWLLCKLFLVIVSVVITGWKFILQTPMTISTLGFINALIEIHNYLYVLCLCEDIGRGK